MISAEIIEVEEETTTGNIITWVCFLDNGKEIVWNSPSGLLIRNSRNVWPLLSGNHNFMSLSEAERNLWIRRNVESQMDNIIKQKAKAALNVPVIADLKSLVGTTYAKDTADVQVGIPGTADKRIVTVKDDGTWVVKG